MVPADDCGRDWAVKDRTCCLDPVSTASIHFTMEAGASGRQPANFSMWSSSPPVRARCRDTATTPAVGVGLDVTPPASLTDLAKLETRPCLGRP